MKTKEAVDILKKIELIAQDTYNEFYGVSDEICEKMKNEKEALKIAQEIMLEAIENQKKENNETSKAENVRLDIDSELSATIEKIGILQEMLDTLQASYADFKGLVNDDKSQLDEDYYGKQNSVLTDEEREYLKQVIAPFRDRVKYIKLEEFYKGHAEIYIHVRNEDDEEMYFNSRIILPIFKRTERFKGMMPEKEYTLQELGL